MNKFCYLCICIYLCAYKCMQMYSKVFKKPNILYENNKSKRSL